MLTFSILRQLYFALIHPHILYCIEAWGSTYEIHAKSLITLQKRAVRVITFSPPQCHTEDLFKFIKILPFHKLYFSTVCLLVYNELSNMSSVKFGFQDCFSSHCYNTRNRNIMSQSHHRTNYFCQSVLNTGPKFYNLVPNKIKNSFSVFSFKSKLKHWLLNENLDVYSYIYPHRKLSS